MLSSASRSCGALSHGESITPLGSGTTGVKRHSGMLKGCLSTPSTSPSFLLDVLLLLGALDLDPLGLLLPSSFSLPKLSVYHFLFCRAGSSHSGMMGLRVSTPRTTVRATTFFWMYFSVNCPRAYFTISPFVLSSTLTLHRERAGLYLRMPVMSCPSYLPPPTRRQPMPLKSSTKGGGSGALATILSMSSSSSNEKDGILE
mmetsp:Transcript_61149/g.147161  ORF Transcript_61149/g.147161 Transcript_61149/m.147161 type:complete len:201 (-) Transcript_61149:20-622(-)